MADILQITLPDGTTYNLKDSTAVTNVSWDSTNYKIQKTINGVTSDVAFIPFTAGIGTDSVQMKSSTATGNYSFSVVQGAQASGNYSVAIGSSAIASGQSAVAIMGGNATQLISIAIGGQVGDNATTTASNTGAIAIGASALSSGQYSMALGYRPNASGQQSVAIGTLVEASATRATSFGFRTKASSQYQTVIGKCNIEDDQDTYAFIIGNGTADDARSNAMTVDWNGNISANNIVTSTNVSNTGLISFLNSNSTAIYTTQLPTYDGSVTGGSPGSNKYVVTITYDDQQDEYSADKTFAQVYAACEAGKVVQAYIDDQGTYYSLNFYNDGAIAFGFLDAETAYLYEFVIGDDDAVLTYDIQLQIV